jgi:transcriptional regulator with XRE-family HTH domain
VINVSTGNELRALIERRKREGWSYRKIAAQTGGGMSPSQVHKLATQPRKHAPPRDQLEALARGLQMPPEIVFAAANKDWTSVPEILRDTTDDGTLIVIASQLRELPDTDRQVIKDMTDTLYRRMKEEERRRASK